MILEMYLKLKQTKYRKNTIKRVKTISLFIQYYFIFFLRAVMVNLTEALQTQYETCARI